jgi:hypothetical protein
VQTFYQLPDPLFSNPRPLGAALQVVHERPEAVTLVGAATPPVKSLLERGHVTGLSRAVSCSWAWGPSS